MSTRCQIDVIDECGNETKIYHHCDGYFSGVGKELKLLLAMQWFSLHSRHFMRELLKNKEYEITENNHGDIEYYYKLDFEQKKFLGWQVDFWPAYKIVEESVIDLTSNDERFLEK